MYVRNGVQVTKNDQHFIKLMSTIETALRQTNIQVKGKKMRARMFYSTCASPSLNRKSLSN